MGILRLEPSHNPHTFLIARTRWTHDRLTRETECRYPRDTPSRTPSPPGSSTHHDHHPDQALRRHHRHRASTFGGVAAGAAFFTPVIAGAQDDAVEAEQAAPERGERISEALQVLVDDGTLTEAQRDAVVETLRTPAPTVASSVSPSASAAARAGEIAEILGLEGNEIREAPGTARRSPNWPRHRASTAPTSSMPSSPVPRSVSTPPSRTVASTTPRPPRCSPGPPSGPRTSSTARSSSAAVVAA